jgi:hypothetical protein
MFTPVKQCQDVSSVASVLNRAANQRFRLGKVDQIVVFGVVAPGVAAIRFCSRKHRLIGIRKIWLGFVYVSGSELMRHLVVVNLEVVWMSFTALLYQHLPSIGSICTLLHDSTFTYDHRIMKTRFPWPLVICRGTVSGILFPR